MGVFVAHTDPTDFTDFLLMVGNLTEALRFVVFCRLTRIPRDSTKRLFVGICVNLWQKKSLQKNIRVIRVFFKIIHKLAQIFTNYLWAKWSVSQ